MALDNKYRVHEVAKDFGVSTREITEILTKYRTEPKNHMQVLDDADLSVIFEYMTQHHQVKNMESLLGAQQSERKGQPAAKQEEKPAEKAPEQTPASSKVKQVHRIDTRGTGDVNLAKYDDHVDKLVDAKAERMESKGPKKQKLTKKSDQRSKPFGNKRRQEEQEKMRRLQRQQQMAALKKIPVKVMIPDEISVGELASRMKRTAADVIKGLIKLGVMASISEVIDYDTAAIVAEEMGCKVEKEVHVTIEEQLFDEHEDKAE
uniref:translation initiation factor IF-2 N-terminal domain-containing protein n=1 Tax=Agathobaculum sp. TaxID=2048138 RepID=UPI003AB631A6